jgi:putative FmdB family regulatory protein
MKKLKLVGATALAVAGMAVVGYELGQGPRDQSRTYDYQCANCQNRFRRHVRSGAEDLAVVECPKCKQIAAEKIMRYQCRKC